MWSKWKKKLTTGVWCDTPTNIVFQGISFVSQPNTVHSVSLFMIWPIDRISHRTIQIQSIEDSRKIIDHVVVKQTRIKIPTLCVEWLTLQRHLAGVTPRSNVLRMCERVGQIGGPTLKCIWHNFFCWLIRKIFHSDEEWHLFYCNSILRCRVIQGFVSCDLDDLWYHKWTKKWSKNNETWNICVNTESTGLKYCKNYTLW